MIVLDTEVLAELLRSEPDASVLAWLAAQRRGELYTTTIGEAEIAAALATLPKGRRRDALTQAVARLLGEGLGGRILPFDRAAAAAYGDLTPSVRELLSLSRWEWVKSRPSPRRVAPALWRRARPPATSCKGLNVLTLGRLDSHARRRSWSAGRGPGGSGDGNLQVVLYAANSAQPSKGCGAAVASSLPTARS